MIYLASPYSHPFWMVREQRYLSALQATHELLKVHRFVFSPIVYCHELARKLDTPTDFNFWQPFNFHMIDCSETFAILRIDGWAQSKGVQEEKMYAQLINKPIIYV